MSINEDIKRIVLELNRHCSDYYKGESSISDEAYDAMYNKLKELEASIPADQILPYSPTQRVGAPVVGEFPKHVRDKPMLSLDNVFSMDELKKWIDGLPLEVEELSLEYKLDGLALELIYEKGHLTKAVTRGDGLTGDVVTEAARTIRNIPLYLPALCYMEKFSVIGECLIKNEDFAAINQLMIDSKVKPFANARNAAAGGLRTLDPLKASARRLSFIAYETDAYDSYGLTDDVWYGLNMLARDGFSVSVASTGGFPRGNVMELIKGMLDDRRGGRVAFATDGLVIKVLSKRLRNFIGYTGRHPKWAVAYKDAPDTATSKLTDIELQVGRTGVITPVGKIEPTEVGGVTVTSVTLHNFDHIEEKGIGVGGEITLHRAGEVIPQILTCVGGKKFKVPMNCPYCGGVLIRDGAFLKCSGGFKCKEQLIRYLQHYVSRPAMNIIGLGDEYIRLLVNSGLVEKPVDLYSLYADIPKLMYATKLTAHQANKLVKAIEASKNTTLGRFIFSLGILEVGMSTANRLANHFGRIRSFVKATPNAYMEVEDVGTVVSENIYNYLNEHDNLESVTELYLKLNVLLPRRRLTLAADKQHVFVITGSFETLVRDSLKEQLLQMGHKVSGSVSKKTTALIAGSNAGSKLEAATKLKVPVWDEKTIKDFIKESSQ